ADAALTGYLALRVPEGLEFHVEEWRHGSGVEKWERAYERQLAARDRSVKRLTAFMTEKRRAAAELTRRYAELAALGVPRWSALASARVGVVHEAFARELERAEVPASFTAEEHYEAYCDALTQRAAPLRRAAAEQYRQCLALATRAGASVEQARACGQALDRLEGTSGEHYEMPVKTSHVELEAAPERVGVVTE
ncbi:MAG: hypothetical protein KC468_20360, partial [Myxococcales bacterium]|nr:hypothetical protein [Myxococcales bacterium]